MASQRVERKVKVRHDVLACWICCTTIVRCDVDECYDRIEERWPSHRYCFDIPAGWDEHPTGAFGPCDLCGARDPAELYAVKAIETVKRWAWVEVVNG